MAQIRTIRNDTLTLGEWKKARKEEAQRRKKADKAKKKW